MRYLFVLSLLLTASGAYSQGTAWGVKGGMTMSTQAWNNFEKEPLFSPHADIYYESVPDISKAAFFIEGGYHIRGISFRSGRYINDVGEVFEPRTFTNKCHNLSLLLGGKKYIRTKGLSTFYYGLGLRGEVTVKSRFQLYEGYEDFVRKINGGFTLSGGWQFPIAGNVQGIFEFRISPDFTKQIYAPPAKFNNPYTGQLQTFPEQNVRNVSFELAVGFRIFQPYEETEADY